MSDAIKPVIRELANTLKEGAELKDGIIMMSADAYERSLAGTDLTLEVCDAVRNHNKNLISAVGLVTGELGIEAMKKDKKLEQVSAELAVGTDSVSAVFQRSKEGLAAPGSKETVTRLGVLTSKFVVDANGNKGDYKKVRTHLSSLAAEALK